MKLLKNLLWFFRKLFYRKIYLKSAYWKRTAWEAKRRAYWHCEVCGAKGPLDVHHLVYHLFREQPDELIVLCRQCHKSQHYGW